MSIELLYYNRKIVLYVFVDKHANKKAGIVLRLWACGFDKFNLGLRHVLLYDPHDLAVLNRQVIRELAKVEQVRFLEQLIEFL